MTFEDIITRNKIGLTAAFSGDYRLILNKVHEKELITLREYNNLKDINKENVEGHVVELVDKILNKRDEDICKSFLNLLQTDDIKRAFPSLGKLPLGGHVPLSPPVQASSSHNDLQPPGCNKENKEDFYILKSKPKGLCVVINNKNFEDGRVRNGTDNDADCLAEVFTWLGFRVLMCKDLTKDKMQRALMCFASLSDPAQLQLKIEFNMKEWSDGTFTDPQHPLLHGDAFFCCILSHGNKGVVYGIDSQSLYIETITSTFKSTEQPALDGKPKVFLIQACQGLQRQSGVTLETDDPGVPLISEQKDVLVALSTVEDYVSFRDKTDGSWFIQALCDQLWKCSSPGGEDITTILHCVNSDVSGMEGSKTPGEVKQMSKYTTRLKKTLLLSPHPM